MLNRIWLRTPRSVGRLLTLAAVLALVLSLQVAAPSLATGLCRICRVTDPCTGTVYTDAGCCPTGQTPLCLECRTTTGCICGVAVVCH